MRILIVSWEYPPLVYGGLGRHVHALAEALSRAGHEVVVVTQAAEGSAADSVVNGVRVVRVAPDPPNVDMSELLAWVLALEHALTRAALLVAEEIRPDVVHAHDWVVAHTGVAVQQRQGIPLVATIHATEAGRHQGWLPADLNRAVHSVEAWLTERTDRLITCSSHMRWEVTTLFGAPSGKVDVIANGVDVEQWRVSPAQARRARAEYASDGPLLAFTGRLEWEKGCHTLLDALPRLRRRHPGLRLVIAGKGSQVSQLADQARRLRLGRSVRFLGWVSDNDLRAMLAAADVAIVPSIYEPFGLVALEAPALGTPVVVANTGGLSDVVEDGVTGLRFPPGDHAALADAVSALLSDPTLARETVRAAQSAHARTFTWSKAATDTVETYLRATRSGAKPTDVVERHPTASGDLPSRPLSGNLLAGAP